MGSAVPLPAGPSRPGPPGLYDLHPDGLLIADENGLIEVANRRAASIIGTTVEALVGADIRTALPLQDTEGHSWWSLTDPWKGLAIRSGHRERLLIIPGRHEVLVTARYVRPGRSQPVVQVIVALRDAEARRRAEANNAALISTVAHELRSPLTSVKGFSSTLLRRWGRFTDDQKRLMLQTIDADADRVTRLIGELLDISRIDAGRLEVHKQPVDVGAVINRHIERFVARGHERERFALTIGGNGNGNGNGNANGNGTVARPHGNASSSPAAGGPPTRGLVMPGPTSQAAGSQRHGGAASNGLPEVWADPDRLDQILTNLMENAVRHGEGTVSLSVMADDHAGTPALAVTISDEGEGIAPEHYPLVFTRFWHGSRRGGTGLGLYVVRGLVEAHGGRITVGRGPAGGAQFRFTLPTGAPEHLL